MGSVTYPPTDAWGRVNHVDAGGVGEDLPVADDVRYVDVALDAALLEGHVVLCEGARLVREDVLYLWAQHTQVRLCTLSLSPAPVRILLGHGLPPTHTMPRVGVHCYPCHQTGVTGGREEALLSSRW
jgi:hypothetical protein